jgi:hypothetical protein
MAHGDLTYQPEITQGFSYKFNADWSLIYWLQDRHWVYEDRYTLDRHRIVQWLQLSQKITDTFQLVYGYDYFLEKDTRAKPVGADGGYKNTFQNGYVGFYTDITPKFNIQPMLSAWPTDPQFDLKSFWLQVWIGYTFK